MYGIPIPHAASKANIRKTEVWHVSLPHFRLRLVIGLDAHHAQDTKCGKSIYIYSFWHLAHISTVCISFIWSSTQQQAITPLWDLAGNREPMSATSAFRRLLRLCRHFDREPTWQLGLVGRPPRQYDWNFNRVPFRKGILLGVPKRMQVFGKADSNSKLPLWGEPGMIFLLQIHWNLASTLNMHVLYHPISLSNYIYSLWKQCVDAAFPQSYTIITSNVQAGKNILSLTVQHFLCMPFSVSLHLWFYRRI